MKNIVLWPFVVSLIACGGSSGGPIAAAEQPDSSDLLAIGPDAEDETSDSSIQTALDATSVEDGAPEAQATDGPATEASIQAEAAAAESGGPQPDAMADAANVQPDAAADASEDGPSCTDACVVSQSECTNDTVQTCQTQANGCTQWVATQMCGLRQMCSVSGTTASCAPICTDSCSQGQRECVNDQMARCTLGSNGCWAYGPPTACPGVRQTCVGAAGSAQCVGLTPGIP
jgi:hypothetical protein